MDNIREAKPETKHLRDQAVRTLAPNGFLLPHFRTFTAVVNTFSQIYSHRYDEVIRKSRSDALALKRDVYIRALLQERILPLGRWKWEIEADPDDVAEELAKNPKDPRSVEREQIRTQLQAILKRTPRLARMRRSLGWGIWYGRQGVQWVPGRATVAGQERTVVRDYRPIMGDKILFDFDGVPGVMIQRGAAPPEATVRYTDSRLPVLLLDREEYRERVIIHTHDLDDADITEPMMAGRIHGIGIRDMIAWGAELRLEIMASIFDFMEKIGNLGLLIVRYPEGNELAKAAAENTARNASGRSAIAVPTPKNGAEQSGIELIPANMTGVQFLVGVCTDWFERHMERAVVGQSMSSGGRDTQSLGGTGRAEFAENTKHALLSSDAEDQAETFTEDWIPPLQRANFPGCEYRYTWQYRIPDPDADSKLDAISKVGSLSGKKLTYKASEIRELTGTTKPGEDDEIVGGDDPQETGQEQVADNPPTGADQGEGEDGEGEDIFGPGEFEAMVGEVFDAPELVPFLSGRSLVHYASGSQWTAHTLKTGPRKGQQVYKNETTGEIRDTPPKDGSAAKDDTPKRKAAGNAEGGNRTEGNDEARLRIFTAAIRSMGAETVAKAKAATVRVYEALGSIIIKLAERGITYQDALNDLDELSNPLKATTAHGIDHVAVATGIPSASWIGLNVVPAVAAYAVTKAKKYLRAKYGKPESEAPKKATYSKANEREQLLAEFRTAIMKAVAGLDDDQLVDLKPAQSKKPDAGQNQSHAGEPNLTA